MLHSRAKWENAYFAPWPHSVPGKEQGSIRWTMAMNQAVFHSALLAGHNNPITRTTHVKRQLRFRKTLR
jgi:hypothetical protein